MPITQLQDSGGLGSIIGSVGGYLAANPERKAKKAQLDIENKRNAANDAATAGRDRDYHDEVTANIAKGQAQTDQTKTDAANTQLQNGAYSKLSTSLHGPRPPGVSAQQWVTYLQGRVLPMGLTDPDLQGKLLAQAQEVLAKDQAQSATDFVKREQTLPGDPKKAIGTLMKRQQAEGGVPGIDPKRTQDMITATQKQITEAQAAAHQNAVETRQSHHDTVLENQGAERLGIEHQNANKPRESDNPNSVANQRFGWERHTFNMTHNADGTTKGTGKTAAEKPRGLSVADSAAIDREARVALRDPNASPEAVAKKLSAKWGIPMSQAQAFMPDAPAAAPQANAPAPAAPGGGTKKTVSIKAAMALPNNKGKSQAQVQSDIEAHGYSVAP